MMQRPRGGWLVRFILSLFISSLSALPLASLNLALAVPPGNVDAPEGPPVPFTPAELQALSESLQHDAPNHPGAADLSVAIEAYREGDTKVGDAALRLYLQKTQGLVSNLNPITENRLQLKFAIQANPAAARRIFSQATESLKLFYQKTYEEVSTGKADTLTKLNRALSPSLNRDLERASFTLGQSLNQLSRHLLTARPDTLIRFATGKADILYRFSMAAEALDRRSETAREQAEDLSRAIERFLRGEKWKPIDHQDAARIRGWLDRQKSEDIFDVWVNRSNVQVAVLSALLTAEGLCTVSTFGFCAPTIPGTVALLARASTGIQTTARVYASASAALNIADTFQLHGAAGLLNLHTAMDLLILMASAPTPAAGSAWLTKSPFPKLLPQFRPIESWVRTQFWAGKFLNYSLAPYGAWQVIRCHEIAETLTRDGVDISPQQIRNQGWINIALSLMISRSNSRSAADKRAESQELDEALSKAEARALAQSPRKSPLLIWNPARDLFQSLKNFRQAPTSNALQIARSVGTIGYDALFYHAVVLMSFTYPDHTLAKRAGPIPDLGPGEIAVTMNGFDPSDLLYYGFHSRHSQDEPLRKYREGVNYFDVDFTDAWDFFKKLDELSKKHGKIRYLRIAAHGIPGKIATRALNIEGNDAFIDTEFLNKNREELRKITTRAFAPDASVIIYSCLVGSNLDTPMEVRGYPISLRAGDEFTAAFGKTVLPNGGTLHTSRRILVALDAGGGSLLESTLLSGVDQPEIRQSWPKFYSEHKGNFQELLRASRRLMDAGPKQSKKGAGDEFEFADTKEILKTTLERVVTSYQKIWSMIYKYGLNLEGNFFFERYRRDEFKASSDH